MTRDIGVVIPFGDTIRSAQCIEQFIRQCGCGRTEESRSEVER